MIVSARDPGDMEILQEAILKSMKQILVPYHMEVSSSEGGLLSELREHTLLEKQEFEEELQTYIVEGYARKESRWNGASTKE